MRKLFTAAVAASLSVWGSSPGWAQPAPTGQEPGRLQLAPMTVTGAVSASPNQQLADAVAETLNHSPLLKQFRVNISAQDGQVHLSGIVQTQAQRIEVLRLAQSVAGVANVRDQLHVVTPGDVVPAQALPPLTPQTTPTTLPQQPTPQTGDGQLPKVIGKPKEPKKPGEPGTVPPGTFPPGTVPPGTVPPGTFPPGTVPPGMLPPGALPPGALLPQPPGVGAMPGPGGMLEPMPLQGAPPGFPSATQPPPMPPYAWPTYAPYNNYSRVAYPNLYPYESFPFIGPIYPFPKIPLGWRSVNLTWEDGHWWLGRNATGHDWWRIRYW